MQDHSCDNKDKQSEHDAVAPKRARDPPAVDVYLRRIMYCCIPIANEISAMKLSSQIPDSVTR